MIATAVYGFGPQTIDRRIVGQPRPVLRQSHTRTDRQPRIAAVEDEPKEPLQQNEENLPAPQPKRSADSTDAVASFLTRRFGVGAGFAWLAILAVGSLGEQIKTRLEVRREEEGVKDVINAERMVLPSGVQYMDQKTGGGPSPYKGALTAINLKGSVITDASDEVFEDSFSTGKQIVFLFGGRPLSDALCVGLEEALESMRSGGIREVIVPAEYGFGAKGTVLFSGKGQEQRIPANATLKYLVELKRVSIAP